MSTATTEIEYLKRQLKEALAANSDLRSELCHREQTIHNLECNVESIDINNGQLLEEIAELKNYITDLENALAEAHLTSVDSGLKNESGDKN